MEEEEDKEGRRRRERRRKVTTASPPSTSRSRVTPNSFSATVKAVSRFCLLLFCRACRKSINSGLQYQLFLYFSNWILTACQPHRVTSWQSNSITSKHTLQNLSCMYYMYTPFLKLVHNTNPYTTKHAHTNIKHKYLKRVGPFSVTPLKRTHV